MKILRFIKCYVLKDHAWTSASMKGEKPKTPIVDIEKEFWEYAKMYCEHCGHESELNYPRKEKPINDFWKTIGDMAVFFGLIAGTVIGGCSLMAFMILMMGNTFVATLLWMSGIGIAVAIMCWVILGKLYNTSL